MSSLLWIQNKVISYWIKDHCLLYVRSRAKCDKSSSV